MMFKKYFSKKNSKKGFTLVEVIAAVAVLSIISGATISIFLAVQKSVSHTSEITVDQYNTTQVERFIRNEFQVASGVTIDTTVPVSGDKDDMICYYDAGQKRVCFSRVMVDGGNYEDYLTIDSVESVQIKFNKLDISTNPDAGSKPYRMTYVIDTLDYQYSGGIVLGNTCPDDGASFDNMAGGLPDTGATINWGDDNSSGTPVPYSTNSTVIKFHSEVAAEVSTP
ncbi:MAG: prepilin-type N-terminal cleavage/methylation domain-containing protein [Lachnospiraceae bacterium]|nr:prepilin-type N-terminal cleavage/methylation domain-containing protein [Lachnospiraceae bacterium]